MLGTVVKIIGARRRHYHAIRTYSMCFVFRAAKVHHAVEAGEGRASTLIAMRVELLLREDVAAVLGVANTPCQ